MSPEDWSNVASAVESMATATSLVVGGIWIYWLFFRQRQNQPAIDSGAEIRFIGKQSGWWIVELVATVANKGKVRHKIESFAFDLNALGPDDPVELWDAWGGQVNFPHELTRGSLLPPRMGYFFIDPGCTSQYSHVTRVPEDARFVIFHAWFRYPGKDEHHSAEATAKVPTYLGAGGDHACNPSLKADASEAGAA